MKIRAKEYISKLIENVKVSQCLYEVSHFQETLNSESQIPEFYGIVGIETSLTHPECMVFLEPRSSKQKFLTVAELKQEFLKNKILPQDFMTFVVRGQRRALEDPKIDRVSVVPSKKSVNVYFK